jgi:CheY-like chemotaxis protein
VCCAHDPGLFFGIVCLLKPDMNPATILYVEDDSNDVLLFKHAIERVGSTCNLQVFTDSEEAVSYLNGAGKFSDRARFPLPDVVLLDLKMPRINGFEFLAWMREHDHLRCLPVIVLSSSNHAADIQRAYASGANSYLVKPIDFVALVELVKSLHQYWLSHNQCPRILEPSPFVPLAGTNHMPRLTA